MDSSNRKGKAHVPEDPESEPSLSDSSLRESDLSNDSNYIKSKRKKRDTKKKYRKHKKQDSLDSSSSDSDSSDGSYYRRKRRKKNIHRRKYPIKLCARLKAKLLTTAYKLNIIKFKLDKDPLKRRIYFLTFVESLEMIFSQYK